MSDEDYGRAWAGVRDLRPILGLGDQNEQKAGTWSWRYMLPECLTEQFCLFHTTEGGAYAVLGKALRRMRSILCPLPPG